jgi:hypothetical protein
MLIAVWTSLDAVLSLAGACSVGEGDPGWRRADGPTCQAAPPQGCSLARGRISRISRALQRWAT